MENSIDAGSANLAIQVERGGTGLIRIIDDGLGMDQDDLLLCLERHATSKLSSVEQLNSINTLGFRGEAIPSIASVSKLTITSRPVDALLGSRLEARFGRVMKVHEMGCRQGTVIEVRDLFGNVPARKKFLKTTQTELAHIEEAVRNYGLAYHELGVSYTVDGKELFNLPAGTGDRQSRIRHLLYRNQDVSLLPVSLLPESSEAGIEISGYLVPPDYPVGAAARIRIFVNGRSVKDRMVAHAISEGAQSFLMKGRRPSGVLFIKIDPESIDVNVHPTKQEVRFRQGNVVHQMVVLAVSRAINGYQQTLKKSLFANRADENQELDNVPPAVRKSTVVPGSLPFVAPEDGPFPKKNVSLPQKFTFYDNIIKESAPGVVAQDLPSTNLPSSHGLTFSEPQPNIRPTDSCQVTEYGSLRLIGQLANAYILCESDDGLVVIDQHAAQERLIFERLKKQFNSGKVVRQVLLFPEVMEFGPAEAELLVDYQDDIVRLGIDLEEFGGASFVVKAVPAVMAHLPTAEIVLGVISQFGQFAGGRDQETTGKRVDGILANMACKASIKAGHDLLPEEMESLLRQMLEADVFSHCPHGRPVVKSFSADEIKRWFKRT